MNNKITYNKVGDYYLPNLYFKKDEYEKDYQIGKYGDLRLEYLKTHKKAEYTIMLIEERDIILKIPKTNGGTESVTNMNYVHKNCKIMYQSCCAKAL